MGVGAQTGVKLLPQFRGSHKALVFNYILMFKKLKPQQMLRLQVADDPRCARVRVRVLVLLLLLLGRRCVRVLGCWCVLVLRCWCVLVLGYWFVFVLRCWCVLVLGYWFVFVLGCWCVFVLELGAKLIENFLLMFKIDNMANF